MTPLSPHVIRGAAAYRFDCVGQFRGATPPKARIAERPMQRRWRFDQCVPPTEVSCGHIEWVSSC